MLTSANQGNGENSLSGQQPLPKEEGRKTLHRRQNLMSRSAADGNAR